MDAPNECRAPARIILYVCRSCKGEGWQEGEERAGARLSAATLAAASERGDPRIDVQPFECLGNCKRGLSAALACPGGWSYVFGDLDEARGADLVEGACLMADGGTRPLVWRGRPDCLKKGMVARIPPLPLPVSGTGAEEGGGKTD